MRRNSGGGVRNVRPVSALQNMDCPDMRHPSCQEPVRLTGSGPTSMPGTISNPLLGGSSKILIAELP
eukprot:1414582-Alexandrium_andersonii.AAC.1